ncbi:pyridoxal 5'-phosphate synthase glutaminase subunit PdxT [bacterium]|nr:pyridoxal 5'-phosphate synthase glutaminase subunit PdxT [bacterium]
MNFADKTIGVLALQGDYSLHERQIIALGAKVRQVRLPRDLEGIDALIMPGGESTTMDILIDRFGLREPLATFGAIKPIYGTCAGMILLARNIERNQAGVKTLGLIDIDVARNDYGRQIYSFEEEIEADFHGEKKRFLGGFIRAPRVTRVGPAVTVLARFQDWPVLVEQNKILAATFHSELESDTTLLEYFFVHFLLDRADTKRILDG